MNPVFAALPTSIFETMSLAAKANGAINLGQGFPETDGFPQVREAAARALMDQSNQYAPMRGLSVLRQAVSDFYRRTQGIALDPDREIVVTSGATEAICAALLALISSGDEVIVFEPMYDAYIPLIERAGGIPRIVQLKPPLWRFSDDDLKAAFNDRTRAVLLTTPNNPTTTCLDREQLDLLAGYCERFDACVIADEVWEQATFGQAHLSVLHLDALRNRGVKIGSAGKIFSLTGWKVGFVCAAPELADQIARAHQFITFSTPPALQHGVASGLNLPLADFDAALSELAQQRACLSEALTQQGFALLPGEGTYFLNIDLRASGVSGSGFDIAQQLVQQYGVAAIPLQAFCPTGRDLPVLRLCFAKSLPTLEEGARRLGLWRRAQI
jgi:aspartate/methionine/tyrosine aminotransferase